MASRRPRSRRFLLPAILAMVLAAEVTGIALARTFAPLSSPVAASVPVAATPAAAPPVSAAAPVAIPSRLASRPSDGASGQLATSTPPGQNTPVHPAVATTMPRSAASSRSHSTYRGTNHVWIPSLGIDKGVQSFPCSRSRPPDAGVYRWGCAGRNNVYLLGHAWSTFKPLHDAYVGGRLHMGMRVIYADGSGSVHTYSVVWWRVVRPTTAASWAWASLSRPSMTLQTCVGANSAYRLMVRLVEVG